MLNERLIMEQKDKILVIFSGGQDSTTCLFDAIDKHGAGNVYAISFNYGQKHAIELDAATEICKLAGITQRHSIVDISDHILVSMSPLTNPSEPLEQYENAEQMEDVIGDRVEKTFVPMRNTLFLTIAFNRAMALGCKFISTGVCQEDNANYPDCTQTFITMFEEMANQSLGKTWGGNDMIRIVTPLMRLTKAQTVRLARSLPGCWEALAYSHTSYDGKYPPTDMNHANVLRAKGFEDAGFPDPLVVRAYNEGRMDLPNTPNYDVSKRHIRSQVLPNEPLAPTNVVPPPQQQAPAPAWVGRVEKEATVKSVDPYHDPMD